MEEGEVVDPYVQVIVTYYCSDRNGNWQNKWQHSFLFTSHLLIFLFKIQIHGHADDFNDPENHKETTAIDNNGLNPTWMEGFTFNIKVPELAFLDLKVTRFSLSNL